MTSLLFKEIYVLCSFLINTLMYKNVKDKGKAVPLQAWSGPEISRKLRFPDFLTTSQDGGKFVSLMRRPHVVYREEKVKQSRYRPGVAQRVPGS
jgi:hypothetical protein